jgi:hypothetical protein
MDGGLGIRGRGGGSRSPRNVASTSSRAARYNVAVQLPRESPVYSVGRFQLVVSCQWDEQSCSGDIRGGGQERSVQLGMNVLRAKSLSLEAI